MKVVGIREVNQNILNSFSCGNEELDRFFKRNALANDQNGYGKTFVLINEKDILGFFTLCSSSIKFDEYPNKENEKLPKYPIPCIKIARLAVNKKYQHQGYGKELLKQAFLRVLSVSTTIGVRLIAVDAKKSAISFYTKYGFSPLENNKNSYYLLIDTLLKAFK